MTATTVGEVRHDDRVLTLQTHGDVEVWDRSDVAAIAEPNQGRAA